MMGNDYNHDNDSFNYTVACKKKDLRLNYLTTPPEYKQVFFAHTESLPLPHLQ